MTAILRRDDISIGHDVLVTCQADSGKFNFDELTNKLLSICCKKGVIWMMFNNPDRAIINIYSIFIPPPSNVPS